MPTVLLKDPVWARLGYTPNRAQRRMHACTTRNVVVAAGRRTGKSTGWGYDLVPHALRAYTMRQQYEEAGQRAEYWCVGPEYSDSEKEFRAFYNACKKLQMPLDRPGTYYNSDAGDMTVSLWQGKFIFTAKSAKHPERLVGEGLHGVIMAEAAKMKESVWSKYVRPTLADFRGWSHFGSTPEGRNWFYNLWLRGQDPNEEEWESFRFPSWVNEFVYPLGGTDASVRAVKRAYYEERYLTPKMVAASGVDPEIISLMRDLDEVMFQQEIEARFGQYVGRVFADWDEEVHCKHLPYDPTLPVYLATDYGWTNPFVVLFIQVNVFGDVFVINEYYETHHTDLEVAQHCLADGELGPLIRAARELFPDPEDPKASNQLAAKWKVQIRGGTGGPRNDRLNAIRRYLKIQNLHLPYDNPSRRPKLFVDRRKCPNLIREMDAYRYPSGTERRNNPEDPVDKDNHAPEALGRFFGGMYGPNQNAAPRSSQASYAR